MLYVNYVIIIVSTALLTSCMSPRLNTVNTDPTLADHQRSNIVMNAMALLNSPYRYGGAHPNTGFDCSGLVLYILQAQTSSPVPRQSSEQAQLGRAISKDELQAGDLVFFNTLGKAYSHVGIYIGDGNFINAPSSGGHVRIDSLYSPYFAPRFTAARSLF